MSLCATEVVTSHFMLFLTERDFSNEVPPDDPGRVTSN